MLRHTVVISIFQKTAVDLRNALPEHWLQARLNGLMQSHYLDQ